MFEGTDDCYRIELWRSWGDPGAPYALWIGCNPSIAAEDVDDPTVSIEQRITRALPGPAIADLSPKDRRLHALFPAAQGNLTQYLKMNVSPYRCTDPSQLKRAMISLDPPGHVLRILIRAMGAERVILACGDVPGVLRRPLESLVALLRWAGVKLEALGTTANGSPRHPLYLPRTSIPARWYGFVEGFGPTFRFFDPDQHLPPQDGLPFEVGDCWAERAPRSKRLRDLNYYQVCGFEDAPDTLFPIIKPAAHLAYRYKAEVDAWAERAAKGEL